MAVESKRETVLPIRSFESSALELIFLTQVEGQKGSISQNECRRLLFQTDFQSLAYLLLSLRQLDLVSALQRTREQQICQFATDLFWLRCALLRSKVLVNLSYCASVNENCLTLWLLFQPGRCQSFQLNFGKAEMFMYRTFFSKQIRIRRCL